MLNRKSIMRNPLILKTVIVKSFLILGKFSEKHKRHNFTNEYNMPFKPMLLQPLCFDQTSEWKETVCTTNDSNALRLFFERKTSFFLGQVHPPELILHITHRETGKGGRQSVRGIQLQFRATQIIQTLSLLLQLPLLHERSQIHWSNGKRQKTQHFISARSLCNVIIVSKKTGVATSFTFLTEHVPDWDFDLFI